MPNPLTGDFDAVVEIGIPQINGLLATLHQKGVSQDNPLALLHSATFRVGDSRRTFPDVGDFGDWVLEYHRTHAAIRPGDLPDHLITTAPPGAASRMKEVFSRFGQLPQLEPVPEVVRGKAEVQVSTVTISLPAGSTSEVAVHAHVRARYTPDPETTDLPQPVHGEVVATYEARVVTDPSDHRQPPDRKLLIRPSAQDSKISFIPAPGSGLSTADAARLSTQVRKVVREGIQMLPVDLTRFPFSEFKGLGTGAGQVLALPLQLSDTAPPTGGVHNVSNVFLDSAGFAIGISKEFVNRVFQPTINTLLQFRRDFEVSIPGPNPTYRFAVTAVHLEFNAGTIDLVIRGKATHSWLPDFNNIVIRQRFALAILFDWLFIRAAEFEPTVSGLSISVGWFTYNLPTGAVKDAVRAERDRTLPAAEIALNQDLRNALGNLNSSMHAFDPTTTARFRSGFSHETVPGASNGVAITADGVIVRGDLHTTGVPPGPQVQVDVVEPGKTYSALQSWIPGGRIHRFVWTWIEGNPLTPLRGSVKTHVDEHRFILQIPAPPPGPGLPPQVNQVCLRLEGTHTRPNGSTQSVVAGGACQLQAPEPVMDVPSWWAPVMVPLWLPESTNGRVARENIAAHVTVQSDSPRNGQLTRNTLVCFVDWNADAPLSVIADALARTKRRAYALGIVAVLPEGTFDRGREELDRRLHSDRISVPVSITEDDDGGWTRTFGPVRVPSIYLINARREFVWHAEGEPDAGTLAEALDKHLVAAPGMRTGPLRLKVDAGESAPDAFFKDGANEFALHRLRGRRVLLNFWQSWSTPCVKELRRLQQMHAAEGDVPFIVAFHGGKDPKQIEQIRTDLGLSFVIAQDAEQRIARRYGVRCWPTTVTLDAAGVVRGIQYGISSNGTPTAASDVQQSAT